MGNKAQRLKNKAAKRAKGLKTIENNRKAVEAAERERLLKIERAEHRAVVEKAYKVKRFRSNVFFNDTLAGNVKTETLNLIDRDLVRVERVEGQNTVRLVPFGGGSKFDKSKVATRFGLYRFLVP